MVTRFLIIFSLIGSLAHAQDAVQIKKGESAQFDGFLVKEERVQELRRTEQESKYNSDLNESLKKSLSVQDSIIHRKDDQINLLLDQNDKLAKSSYSNQSMTNWEKALWFGVGMLAMYGTLQLAKEATR